MTLEEQLRVQVELVHRFEQATQQRLDEHDSRMASLEEAQKLMLSAQNKMLEAMSRMAETVTKLGETQATMLAGMHSLLERIDSFIRGRGPNGGNGKRGNKGKRKD